jgi:phospholipid transport system substrate-binding protein
MTCFGKFEVEILVWGNFCNFKNGEYLFMKYTIKLRNFFIVFLSLSAVLFMNAAIAEVTSPVSVLNNAANQMLSSLAENKSRLHKGDGIIYSIVNRVLLPYIDLDRMGMAVVGRQYWTAATPAQKNEFIKQFTHLVTSTYAAALASYNDDKVQFFPLRTDYNNSKILTIRSVIIRRTGQRIEVDYNVIRDGDTWKVYDFSIENVSMVQSYRSQFSDVLAKQGMPGLLKRLQSHNQNS